MRIGLQWPHGLRLNALIFLNTNKPITTYLLSFMKSQMFSSLLNAWKVSASAILLSCNELDWTCMQIIENIIWLKCFDCISAFIQDWVLSQIIPLVSSGRLELVHQLEDKYSALLPRNSSNHRLFPWFLTTQGQECSPVGDVLDFRLPSGLWHRDTMSLTLEWVTVL